MTLFGNIEGGTLKQLRGETYLTYGSIKSKIKFTPIPFSVLMSLILGSDAKKPHKSLLSVSCQTVDITLQPARKSMEEEALLGSSKPWKNEKYVMASTQAVPSQEAGDIKLEGGLGLDWGGKEELTCIKSTICSTK